MTERKNYFERELQKVEDKIKAKVEELRKDGKYYKCKLGKIKYSFRNIHKWED